MGVGDPDPCADMGGRDEDGDAEARRIPGNKSAGRRLTGAGLGGLFTRIVESRGVYNNLGEMGAESGGLLPPLSTPFAPTLDKGLEH